MLVLWVHWPPGSFRSHPAVLAQPRIVYTSSSPVPLVFPVSSPCSPLHWPPRCVAASPLPRWVKLVQSVHTVATLRCLLAVLRWEGQRRKSGEANWLWVLEHAPSPLHVQALPLWGITHWSDRDEPCGQTTWPSNSDPWLARSVTLGKRLNTSEL